MLNLSSTKTGRLMIKIKMAFLSIKKSIFNVRAILPMLIVILAMKVSMSADLQRNRYHSLKILKLFTSLLWEGPYRQLTFYSKIIQTNSILNLLFIHCWERISGLHVIFLPTTKKLLNNFKVIFQILTLILLQKT